MATIEYSFIPNYYIGSKDVYEKYICDCLNLSSKMIEFCGGTFSKIEEQSHGEPDVIVNTSNYGLDFKLMISQTLAEFRNLSSAQIVEIAKGVKAYHPGKAIKQRAVLLPNACRNITEAELTQYRAKKDVLSKAIVHFFDRTLCTQKNILLYLPLFITTVNKSIPYSERVSIVENEFSTTLQYIFDYRRKNCPNLDTFFVYILNDETKNKFYFNICQFTTRGLIHIDSVDMFSIPSIIKLAEENSIF